MCNINILIKDKKDSWNVASFMMAVTASSYSRNPDGEGLFCDSDSKSLFIKQNQKINLLNYGKLFKDGKFIITHQRLSTSGFNQRWHHPFVNKDFVFVHNGIINRFLGKKGSDSYGFFMAFTALFNKLQTGTREERIVQSIKHLLDGLDDGSYSIAIYDRRTEKLYYCKNSMTNIHFFRFARKLYITTLHSNSEFIPMLSKQHTELDIKDYTIYRANKKQGEPVSVYSIANIKEPEPPKETAKEETTKQKKKTKDEVQCYDYNPFEKYSCQETY